MESPKRLGVAEKEVHRRWPVRWENGGGDASIEVNDWARLDWRLVPVWVTSQLQGSSGLRAK